VHLTRSPYGASWISLCCEARHRWVCRPVSTLKADILNIIRVSNPVFTETEKPVFTETEKPVLAACKPGFFSFEFWLTMSNYASIPTRNKSDCMSASATRAQCRRFNVPFRSYRAGKLYNYTRLSVTWVTWRFDRIWHVFLERTHYWYLNRN